MCVCVCSISGIAAPWSHHFLWIHGLEVSEIDVYIKMRVWWFSRLVEFSVFSLSLSLPVVRSLAHSHFR